VNASPMESTLMDSIQIAFTIMWLYVHMHLLTSVNLTLSVGLSRHLG
jgi:hypothetical protein